MLMAAACGAYIIGAAGSRHQSISDLTQPTHPMNHEIAQRPDQHTGNSTPIFFSYADYPSNLLQNVVG